MFDQRTGTEDRPRRTRFTLAGLAPALIATQLACAPDTPPAPRAPERAPDRAPPPATVATAAPPAPEAAPASTPVRNAVTLIAGGDVSFGRVHGRLLIAEPGRDFFAVLRPWLDPADVRFANLEGPISDQHGEVQRPGFPLIFNGPPEGAAALAHARFTIVSTANNHAWDYGEAGLRETMDRLAAAGVRHVGTGVDRASSRSPAILDVGGFRIAFLAVTDIWNLGPLALHSADAMVARADEDELARAVRAARRDGAADAVVVSYHGGLEYMKDPLPRTTSMLRAAVDAGADVVLGHHPHVIQGVEWRRDKPIFYSLGNLLMRKHRDHDESAIGYLARVEIARGAPPVVWACPFHIHDVDVLPLARDREHPFQERMFYTHMRAISVHLGGVVVEPSGDGCARLRSAARPSMPAR